MEPDVIRMYSSSPPPLEDGVEEEEDDFGDFDGFSSVPNSVSFTEFDTPTTFNQVQALNATSPPELLNNGRLAGLPSFSTTTSNPQEGDLSKANGVLPGGCHSSSPSERTVGEAKKALPFSLDVPGSSHTDDQLPVDCNGEGPEVLTNGFAMLDVQGSPSLQNSVHSCRKGASTEDTEAVLPESQDDEFADFTTFADAGAHGSPTAHTTEALHSPDGDSSPRQGPSPLHCNIEQGIHLEGNTEEAHRVGLDGSDSLSSAELPDEQSNQHQGSGSDTDSKQLDCVHELSDTVCTTTETLALNGFCGDSSEEKAGSGEDGHSREMTNVDEKTARSEEEASGNEMETETQTTLDQPLSTETMEQSGEMSTTGLRPSPLPQEDTATPADHSKLSEVEDEDFGDFDSGGCFSTQGFADFDQLDVQPEPGTLSTELTVDTQQVEGGAEDDDFGDFNTQRFQPAGTEQEGPPLDDDNDNSNNDMDRGQVAVFPGSDSFGNFNSAAVDVAPRADAGWSAFSEEAGQAEDDSWAAFDEEQVSAPPAVQEEWSKPTPEAPPTTSSDQTSTTDIHSVSTGCTGP
ncbi:Aftiphilin [Merluccius polli]|uniref:Aftiphilin n=1 Tax=Merluccius polli TaxID=89951 RepID=A0AA47MBU0_MERPO|nr:Aftiphilin [Merluccius polli]